MSSVRKYYTNEVGRIVDIDTNLDLSSVNTTYISVIKPNDDADVWSGVVAGTNNDIIRYTTEEGDFDQAGVYQLTAQINSGSWTSGTVDPTQITVYNNETDQVRIHETDMNLVKAVLAFPSADTLLLDDDDIRNFCIYPALVDYFKKFPIREEYTQVISTNTETTIAFPDSYTFGATDARIIDKFSTTSSSSSSFWELANYQQQGYSPSGGMYGIKGYNPNGLRQANFTQYQSQQARQKYSQILRIRVDEANSQLVAFSNVTATVYIEWAKYSLDFSNVKFTQKLNVIKLAQYYLLRHLADTASIVSDTNLDININTDELKTKSDELREQVFEEWEQYIDIVLVRT